MTPALWPALLAPEAQGDDALCAESADGVRIEFADGRQVLCGTSGLWNANLGYGNRVIAEAIGRAARDASYLSVFRYENGYARRAAAALLEVADPTAYARVVFSTSGGAANDLVMKLARHHHALRGAGHRKVVVGLRGSYHGLTYGAFGLTGEALGQEIYGVDRRLVRHIDANDVTGLRTLAHRLGGQLAAVVVEPVLGSGTIPLRDDFVVELLRLRDECGFLLVADEVATGFGRTGPFFASQHWPAPPDLLVTSKGLTNGTCAAAAVLVSAAVAKGFTEAGGTDAGMLVHGETQAGTPTSCAAIVATIAEMRRLDAIGSGRRVAALLGDGLDRLRMAQPRVLDVVGVGCFRSIRLRADDGGPLDQRLVPRVVAAIRDAGAIVHPGPHGIQLVPALVYRPTDVDELLDCVDRGLRAALPEPRLPGLSNAALR